MANNLDAFTPEIWSKRIIMNLDRVNVMVGNKLVNRDYEGEIKNAGDTVWVRTFGSISTGNYVKGQTINYQALSPAKELMVVDQQKYFAFEVDDIDKIQNDINALDGYSKRAAAALSNLVEDEILGTYGDIPAANRVGSDAQLTLSTSNVYQYFVEAREKLSAQNVPNDGRWALVDPKTTSLLLRSAEFTRATAFGDRVVSEGMTATDKSRPGYIGRIAGFDVYETNSVPNDGTNKYLLFGDPTAIAYAAQITEMETIRRESTFATAMRGLIVHKAKVFAENAKRLARIKAVP